MFMLQLAITAAIQRLISRNTHDTVLGSGHVRMLQGDTAYTKYVQYAEA